MFFFSRPNFLCSQEKQTLPVGGQEGGSFFFAGSRLSYAVFGCYLFGESVPRQGRWVFLLSRVIEATSTFAICCIDHILGLVTNVRTVTLWCDSGPHFRSYKFLTTLGLRTLEKWNVRQVDINYGAEHHYKSRCDGQFGTTSSWRRDAAKKGTLSTIEDVVTVLNERSKRECELDETRAPLEAIDFLPPKKSEVVTYEMKANALPFGIHSCYSWRFRTNDTRRQSLWARGRIESGIATGVDCRCIVLTGLRGSWTAPFFPQIDPLNAGGAPAEQEARADPPATTARDWEGWRTSWRTAEPDLEGPQRINERLKWRAEKLNLLRPCMVKGERRQSTDVRQGRAQEARLRRGAHARLRRAALQHREGGEPS